MKYFLLLLMVVSAPTLYAQDREALVQAEVLRLTQSGDFDLAYQRIQESKGYASGEINSKLKAGALAGWAGLYEEAFEEYAAVLEKDSNHYDALSGVARVYAWDGRYEEADQAIRDLLETNPDDAELRLLLSKVRVWDRRYQEALPPAQVLMKQDSPSVDVILHLGLVYRKLHQFEQARELYSSHFEGEKEQVLREAYAESYYEENAWLRARLAYTELAERSPDLLSARIREYEIRLFSFSTSYTYDRVRNQADWKELTSTFYFRPYRMFHIGMSYSDVHRFGKSDNVFSLLSVVRPFDNDDWIIEGELSHNIDQDVLWNDRFAFVNSFPLDSKTVPSVGATYLDYDDGISQVYTLGVEQYLPHEFVAAYRFFFGIDFDDRTSMSHELRVCWQRDDFLHVCAGYVFGDEAFEIESTGDGAESSIDVLYLRAKY